MSAAYLGLITQGQPSCLWGCRFLSAQALINTGDIYEFRRNYLGLETERQADTQTNFVIPGRQGERRTSMLSLHRTPGA